MNVLEEGADGLICFDMNRRLLVMNNRIQEMLPKLKTAQTDHMLNETIYEFRRLGECILRFAEDEQFSEDLIQYDDKAYQSRVRYIKNRDLTIISPSLWNCLIWLPSLSIIWIKKAKREVDYT